MPVNDLLVQTAIIEVGGPLPPLVMHDLIDVRVEQTVGLPSRLSARFFDHEFKHIDGSLFQIAKPVVVKFLNKTGVETKVFDGQIVDLGIEHFQDSYVLEVGALDLSFKLDGAIEPRSFLNMTRADIIKKIAGECGLMAQVDAMPGMHPHITQATTHRAFIDELVRLQGMEWWVEEKKLIVGKRKPKPPIKVENGVDLIRCSAHFSGRGGKQTVAMRGWDRKMKKAVVGTAPVKHVPAVDGAESQFAQKLSGQAAKAIPKPVKLLVAPHTADTPAEAKAGAQGYADRIAGSQVTVRGEAYGNPALVAGGKIEITNMGTVLSGKYFLTSVEHVFGGDRPYLTRFTAGAREPTRMVDLLGAGAAHGGRPVPLGLTIGIVTNNNDPDNLGRVKVKLPILDDMLESAWARVITPASGTSTGIFFVPEINDEVLVGFEHADMRHPVVIGGLWNGKNKPPVTSAVAVKMAKVQTWMMKTRTGNTLQFFDGMTAKDPTTKIVVTHANQKNKVTIEDMRVEIDAAQIGSEFAIKCGQASITISKMGDITIDGMNITLKAKQKIVIDAGLMLEAKAATQAKFECSGQGLTVSPVITSLKGAAQAQIQAPMVKVN